MKIFKKILSVAFLLSALLSIQFAYGCCCDHVPTSREIKRHKNRAFKNAKDALISAIGRNDAGVVRRILKKWLLKNDINKLIRRSNREDLTSLEWAAWNGNPKIVQIILKAGGNPNSMHTDYRTVLMSAIDGNNPDVMKLLIEYGADVTAVTSNGNTALHYAAYEGKLEMVKLLIQHGATKIINFGGKDGVTPLHQFIGGGSDNIEVAKFLIESGAGVACKDKYGTALDYAVRLKNKKMIAFLQGYKANEESA